MTRTDLETHTRKKLASMAKHHRVAGWHRMKKEQLIKALLGLIADGKRRGRTQPGSTAASRGPTRPIDKTNGTTRAGSETGTIGSRHRSNGRSQPHADRTTRPPSRRSISRRILTPMEENGAANGTQQDRFTAQSCDPFWIHVRWSLTERTLQRAQAALGPEWHQARPVIRLFRVTISDETVASNTWVCDVEIHGRVDNWYLPVENPPSIYRMHLGYLAPSGKFFVLAKSDQVKTPRLDSNRSAELVRPSGNGLSSARNSQDGTLHSPRSPSDDLKPSTEPLRQAKSSCSADDGLEHPLKFRVDAELIIHGATHPDAKLTLLGEPVPLCEDGTFSYRFTLPDGRQLIPVVVLMPGGNEQRTIVLGVERNTKELEPKILDELLP